MMAKAKPSLTFIALSLAAAVQVAVAASGDVSLSPAVIKQSGATTGINAGYGDRIGAQSKLAVSSDTDGNVTFALSPLDKGAIDGHNAIVIYIDAANGADGFDSTASLTDKGSDAAVDEIREAVSGFNGQDRAALTFAPGFKAGYALAFENAFGSLYQLKDPKEFGFVANKTPKASPSATGGNVYAVTLKLSEIGLPANGSFRYVVTYLDPLAASRSNEYQGVSAATGAKLMNGRDAVTLAAGDFNTFSAAGADTSKK